MTRDALRSRYIAFAWDGAHPPLGGWQDAVGSSDALGSAVEMAKRYGDRWHILDTKTLEIVRRWDSAK